MPVSNLFCGFSAPRAHPDTVLNAGESHHPAAQLKSQI
jgi:hypothetical protein